MKISASLIPLFVYACVALEESSHLRQTLKLVPGTKQSNGGLCAHNEHCKSGFCDKPSATGPGMTMGKCGGLPDGSSCINKMQCKSGFCDMPEFGIMEGKCGRLPDGSSCINKMQCKSGFCDHWGGRGSRCTAFGTVGSSCRKDDECKEGVCYHRNSKFALGKCTSVKPDGGICYLNKQCLSGVCKGAGTWSWTKGKCAPKSAPPTAKCTQKEMESESKKGPWPCCVGLKSNDCRAHIKSVAPEVTISVVEFGNPVTQDIRYDRVRIYVDSNDMVIKAPKRK